MEQMHQLADAVRETFSEHGHNIKKAVNLHESFTLTKHPQSGLARNMVLTTISNEAKILRIGVKPVSGGGRDIQVFDGLIDRRYRVLKATKNADTGGYEIIGSDSILEITDAEPDTFTTIQRWVFAYTLDEAGTIVDVFEARVAGLSKHKVPLLLLEDIRMLGTGLTTLPPSRGFQPPDEDDLGDFSNDEDDTGEDGFEAM